MSLQENDKRRREALGILQALLSSPLAVSIMTRQGLAGPELEMRQAIGLAFALQEAFDLEARHRAALAHGKPEKPWNTRSGHES